MMALVGSFEPAFSTEVGGDDVDYVPMSLALPSVLGHFR